MQDGKQIISAEKPQNDLNLSNEVHDDGKATAEVVEAQQSVSEGLNLLGENAEILSSGKVSEKERNARDVSNGTVAVGSSTKGDSVIIEMPKIEVMIEQTVAAIENELKIKGDEVTAMIRNNRSTPYEVNDLVRRIRFLNGLLFQLKRAAKLAEEFITGLWKQFVGKA